MSQKSPLPGVLWIAIISLALFSIFHFIIGFSNPSQFFAFAINIVLIWGLLNLAKWAYFIAIFASIIGPLVLAYEDTIYFYIVLLLNSTVLIPVLICTRSFFSKKFNQHVPA
jgi:hypothetical protein